MADNNYNIERANRNFAKQRAISRDWLRRTAGLSGEQIANNKYLVERLTLNHLYNLYFAMGDDPNAQRQIEKLDEKMMMLNLREYEDMINATHTAVEEEAYKTLEQVVSDFTKSFNKK